MNVQTRHTLQEMLDKKHIKADLKWWADLKINPQALYEQGFHSFSDQMRKSSFAMQKRYDDEVGKKYFINFYFYYMDPQEFPTIPKEIRASWTAENQFVLLSNGATSNISLHCRGREHELVEVESYFEELFDKMGFAYYEGFSYESEEEMNKKQKNKQTAASIQVQKFEIERALKTNQGAKEIKTKIRKKTNKI